MLGKQVAKAYRDSWIAKYFGYSAQLDLATQTVTFLNQLKKIVITESDRFTVHIIMKNETNKLYFAPRSFWLGAKSNAFEAYPVEILSHTPNGTITAGYPYTKSPFYMSPFFIVFKTNHAIDSNFLIFNDFLIPNSYGRILCLLNYDDGIDKFVPIKKMDICLPYNATLTLANVLEFTVLDAEQKLVKFEDKSQLYISLSVL